MKHFCPRIPAIEDVVDKVAGGSSCGAWHSGSLATLYAWPQEKVECPLICSKKK
jgi:hypothetical protein